MVADISAINKKVFSLQAQAIVVGFFASIAAMIFGWIPEGKFNISHGLLLCASSVTTAALASFVLGKSFTRSVEVFRFLTETDISVQIVTCWLSYCV